MLWAEINSFCFEANELLLANELLQEILTEGCWFCCLIICAALRLLLLLSFKEGHDSLREHVLDFLRHLQYVFAGFTLGSFFLF